MRGQNVVHAAAAPIAMCLLDLPMELVWHVIEHIDTTKNLSAMLRVNRLLYRAFRRHLYRFDVQHHGSSALLWAVTCNHLIVAEHSLRERVHLSEETNETLQGALILAVRCGDCEMVALLGSYGAQVDTPVEPSRAIQLAYIALDMDQFGWFRHALHLACRLANVDMVKLLIRMGADVNKQDPCAGHALLISCRLGSEEIIHLLLWSGASIDARAGCYFQTALQVAALVGTIGAAKLLIGHGADVNARGGHYGTALQAASWRVRRAVVKLLLRSDADVNAPGGRFGSARDAALLGGHKHIEELLRYWSWWRRLRQTFGL